MTREQKLLLEGCFVGFCRTYGSAFVGRMGGSFSKDFFYVLACMVNKRIAIYTSRRELLTLILGGIKN
jgi:hypothetical protein